MARSSDEKLKFIQIIEETPLINYACKKVGIGRTTFYRWMKDNLEFKISVERALKNGRSYWVEVAESSLMKNVKNGRMDAVKFFLTHNDSRYIPKRTLPLNPLTPEELKEFEIFKINKTRNKPINPDTKKAILLALQNWGFIKKPKEPLEVAKTRDINESKNSE